VRDRLSTRDLHRLNLSRLHILHSCMITLSILSSFFLARRYDIILAYYYAFLCISYVFFYYCFFLWIMAWPWLYYFCLRIRLIKLWALPKSYCYLFRAAPLCLKELIDYYRLLCYKESVALADLFDFGELIWLILGSALAGVYVDSWFLLISDSE